MGEVILICLPKTPSYFKWEDIFVFFLSLEKTSKRKCFNEQARSIELKHKWQSSSQHWTLGCPAQAISIYHNQITHATANNSSKNRFIRLETKLVVCLNWKLFFPLFLTSDFFLKEFKFSKFKIFCVLFRKKTSNFYTLHYIVWKGMYQLVIPYLTHRNIGLRVHNEYIFLINYGF